MHNHSSGGPTPSPADIQMTQSIVEIAKPLGIAGHDHIFVGNEDHAAPAARYLAGDRDACSRRERDFAMMSDTQCRCARLVHHAASAIRVQVRIERTIAS